MTFQPIDPKKKLPELEEEVLKFWKEDKTFEKSIDLRKDDESYTFFDGPPFATGEPHYGHILGSTVKDVMGRYWTMKGKLVRRRWGWDCHGLPIENIAEKELGISGKDEIEKMGVKKFNDFCRSKVMDYAHIWGKTVDRIGRWVEFDNAYKTMDTTYIESVWWAFKKIYEKGLIYEGERVLMYCPRCETPMAKAEIAMDNSYRTVKDDTITVKFKLVDENIYALAWTTTPWTLPSNLALTVNPDMEYCYIQDKSDNTTYLLGKDAIGRYFKDENEYNIVQTLKGRDLIDKKYIPLFPYFADKTNSFRIIAGDFVTAEEGTGIVHTAPAFGEVDYDVCKKNNIDFVSPVDKTGKFTAEVPDWMGKLVFDTNKDIIIKLKSENKIVKIEKYEHEYPHCYRCGTPLLYRAIPAWFINIQQVKDKIIELNEKINWIPEHLKHGRFLNIIKEAPDWNISRNRYWASALPIWKCSSCPEMKVIGSIEELKNESINLPSEDISLHKDYLDQIHLNCKCGNKMTRIPEVLDCWFESGAMMFAQFHYPFENKELFEKSLPADFVAEYIAQTRTWFYYCLVISTILFDEIPYKNIVTTGTIMAEDGNKMSKSLKNFPDPWKLFEKYGVDSLRFYLLHGPLMSNAESINFSEKQVEEIFRNVMMRLWNSFVFFYTYASIDKWKPLETDFAPQNQLDKWIISELNMVVRDVNTGVDAYNFKQINCITAFIDNLSNWYIRRSRRRFWKSDSDNDKNEAYQTLYLVLTELTKLMAPFTPFLTETIFTSLTENKLGSVHLQNYPVFHQKLVDEKLSLQMSKVRQAVELGLSARAKAAIKVRQPLNSLEIKGADELQENQQLIDLIKDEVNIKNINFVAEINQGDDWQMMEAYCLQVALDKNITPELKLEGLTRDLVRYIQEGRKKAGFNIEDRILINWQSESDLIKQMFNAHLDYISKETLAEKISEELITNQDWEEEVKLENELLKIQLRKV